MTKTVGVSLAILLGTTLAIGQSAAPPPPRMAFEVASVKQSPEFEPGSGGVKVTIDGSQVHVRFFSLKDYIATAYDVKAYQIQGPDWIANARFDITGKIPEGAPRSKIGEMLQSLLEERFKLVIHRDSKDFPVYAMVVGKSGMKMTEVKVDPATDAGTVNVTAGGSRNGVVLDLGHGSSFSLANQKIEAKKVTMALFAETMGRFVDRPVVDQTGLTGTYDFTIDFSPEDYQAMLIRSAVNAGVSLPPQALKALEYGDGDSIITAMQTVGLKLERRKAPLPILVVDRIEKTPSEN